MKTHTTDSSLRLQDMGDDVFHLSMTDPARWDQPSYGSLIQEDSVSFSAASSYTVVFEDSGAISASDGAEALLSPYAPLPFGVLKDSWVWCFSLEDSMHFYGMGEKNVGFEKSGLRTKFWNTDVWADFGDEDINNGVTDPMYASFPVLIIRKQDHWLAMIVPTAFPVFMDTGARQVIEGVADAGADDQFFYLGASGSSPELYLIVDRDPLVLTSKIQRLSGVTPRPPLWALGYHQSRWGYSTCRHLHDLDRKFREYRIPCDGLWIDIDYMEGYRVFSLNEQVAPDLEDQLLALRDKGRRVVPILDPGVKVDHDFAVCTDGLDKNIFCKTSEGKPFIGFVWPGASYFPDFSKEEGRYWWSAYTKELSSKGFEGFWIDMNDPSTGSVELYDMLFRDGSLAHEAYHNAYGLGMAEATFKGLANADEGKRPFVLTRSGTIGSSRYGAMWTGDNNSNYHHLRKGLEMVLSLSISGMPFAGSDVGGFGADAYKKNYIDWFKTTYLLPLMRNHSADGTREQEPWKFDEQTLQITGTCIRARYALLPYLYQLFIREEASGFPMIRPMIYQYPDDQRFTETAHQFMIGEDLMQAPNLWEESFEGAHGVSIPEGRWIDLYDGIWQNGPCEYELVEKAESLHLFARAGAVIPVEADIDSCDSTDDIDLSRVSFLIIVDPDEKTPHRRSYIYTYDDGISYAYRDGGESTIRIEYQVQDHELQITADTEGLKFYCLGAPSSISVNRRQKERSICKIPVDGMNCRVLQVL
ncbi:MAG: hypothetical protein K9M84_00445 [Spirochaetia bacterium]|nr:hypothetical protein [Spirochaetia bacterium]